MKYLPVAKHIEETSRFERQKGVVIDALQISSRRLCEDFAALARTDQGVIPWSDSDLAFTPFNPITGEFYKGVHALSISSSVLRSSSLVKDDAAKASPMFLLAKDVEALGQRVQQVKTTSGLPVSSLIIQADLSRIENSEEELSDLLSRIRPEFLLQVHEVLGESFDYTPDRIDLDDTLDSLVEASESLGVKTFFLSQNDMPCGFYPANNSLVLDYHGFEGFSRKQQFETICEYTMGLSYASRSTVKGLAPIAEFSRYGVGMPYGKSSRPELYTAEGRIELLKAHYLTSHLFLHFGIAKPSCIPIDQAMAKAWAEDVESAADPALFQLLINDFNAAFEVVGDNLGDYLKERGREASQVVAQISKRCARLLRQQAPERTDRSSVTINSFDIFSESLDKPSAPQSRSAYDL